jgi:putative MATE family efflux protein
MMSNAFYNVVDSIFIGRIGTTAIAAIAVAFPIFAIVAAVGVSFGIGTSSYVSRALGAGQKQRAERAIIIGLLGVVVAGLTFTIVGLILIEPVMRAFGASEAVLPVAVEYGRVLVTFSLFPMLKMFFNNLVRAEGNAKWSMTSMITGAALNIVLDPILIFVLGWGIRGAAIATVVSQAVAFSMLSGYFLFRFSYVRLSFKYVIPANLRPQSQRLTEDNAAIFRQIVAIGSPMFLRQALGSFAIALLNVTAAPFGDAAVASVGVLFRLLIFGMMPIYGFGQGYQPMAGYNYGAKNFSRLFGAMRLSLIWTAMYAGVLTSIALIFAPQILSWFTSDPEVVRIGARGLRMVYSAFPLFGFQIIALVSFQALGKPRPAMMLGLARQFLFLVPTVLILSNLFGLPGILASQGFADFLTSTLAIALGYRLVRTLQTEAHHIQVDERSVLTSERTTIEAVKA